MQIHLRPVVIGRPQMANFLLLPRIVIRRYSVYGCKIVHCGLN